MEKFLIVGLGNPGKKYAESRHNIGFKVVNCLAKKLGVKQKKRKNYYLGKTIFEGKNVLLACPLTFMNLSGTAVSKLVRYHKIKVADNLIIVYDDADLPLGIIRIRTKGSSGGHKGIQSIIQELGTEVFPRLKIGIGKEEGNLRDYVLSKFSEGEKKIVEKTVNISLKALLDIIQGDISKAMSVYNVKPQEEK